MGEITSAKFNLLFALEDPGNTCKNFNACDNTVQQHHVVVVVGEIVSEKTTQLPKATIQVDAKMKMSIGKKLTLSQNRRLVAQLVLGRLSDSVSARACANFWKYHVANSIAEEMDVRLGDVVGLQR